MAFSVAQLPSCVLPVSAPRRLTQACPMSPVHLNLVLTYILFGSRLFRCHSAILAKRFRPIVRSHLALLSPALGSCCTPLCYVSLGRIWVSSLVVRSPYEVLIPSINRLAAPHRACLVRLMPRAPLRRISQFTTYYLCP